jgi:hypothetical protein
MIATDRASFDLLNTVVSPVCLVDIGFCGEDRQGRRFIPKARCRQPSARESTERQKRGAANREEAAALGRAAMAGMNPDSSRWS